MSTNFFVRSIKIVGVKIGIFCVILMLFCLVCVRISILMPIILVIMVSMIEFTSSFFICKEFLYMILRFYVMVVEKSVFA
jgi:hypothetical protein